MPIIPPVAGTDVKKKVLGALDWLKEANVKLSMKGGMTREEAEKWYDSPGDVIVEDLGLLKSKAPTKEQRERGEKNIKTALNFLFPRAEDLVLAGGTLKAGKAGWRGLKKIFKSKSPTAREILESQGRLKVKTTKESQKAFGKMTITQKVKTFKDRAVSNFNSMSDEFFKKKIFMKDPKADWDLHEFNKVVGLEVTEDLLPTKILSKTKQKKWEKLFGKNLSKMHPGRIKRHIKESRKFVKEEMGSKESFEKFLNTVFPEHTAPKYDKTTGKYVKGDLYKTTKGEEIDWSKGLPEDFVSLDVDKYIVDSQDRVDLINFLKSDKDLYKMYKDLVGKTIDNTPYSIVFAKGKHADYWGAFRHRGMQSDIVERWDSAFNGGFTKTHEFTHAVQLKNQHTIVKMTDDDLTDIAWESFSSKFVNDHWSGKLKAEHFETLPQAIQQKIRDKLKKIEKNTPSRFRKEAPHRKVDYGLRILEKNKGRGQGDLGQFQDFLDDNMHPEIKGILSGTHKSTGMKMKGYKSYEHYLRSWYEVGARINEIRHAEKLGVRARKAENALLHLFKEDFVRKLKDNYWAFLPAGQYAWQDEDMWKD